MKIQTYLSLQIKRAFKLYPAILLVTVITTIALVLAVFGFINSFYNENDKKQIDIGVVGDTKDTYVELGMLALEKMDSSRFYVNFIEYDEENAKKDLEDRIIDGYVVVPENFVQDIYTGKNTPVKYVVTNAPDGFGSILVSEVTNVISKLLTEAQNGVYSMQQITKVTGNGDMIWEQTEKLNFKYVNFILNRTKLYDVRLLGISDSLSLGGYYICGIILLFLLLWGISCNRLLSFKNTSLFKLLNAYNLKAHKQIFSEFLAYLVITCLTLAIPFTITGILGEKININEIFGINLFDSILFFIKILPVIMMITMMQILFYEFVSDSVSSVLIQFLVAIGSGYISGCFYPVSYFPQIIQDIAAVLPSGVGFSYLKHALISDLQLIDFAGVAIYFVLFTLTAVFLRKHKISGENS